MSLDYKKDIFRPTAGSKTGRVWVIADKLSNETGRKAIRKDVIAACVKAGSNPNTASKQYDDWQKMYDNSNDGSEQSSGKFSNTDRQWLEMGLDGRILIPVALRKAMQISPGEKITAWVDEGELHIVSVNVGVQKLQAMVRDQIPEGVSLVDELIKDRREEAAKEERELAGS